MKKLVALFCLVALASAGIRAADARVIAAVRAADDERVAATVAADRARLEAIYSDGLRYTHSNGKIDTKASQIKGVVDGPNTCEGFDYQERTFVPAGPGVVLMMGRTVMRLRPKAGGPAAALDLNYLAVWREEGGRWRFFAWQSCKNTPAGGAKK
jgi:ketosteroid isomerase-like protein